MRIMLRKGVKGDVDFVTVPVGVIFFIAIIIALMLFVQASLLKVNADLGKTEIQLQAVDAAHMIKACLEKDGAIQASQLEQLKNAVDPICGVCKVCTFNTGARLEYLEPPPGKHEPFDYNFRSDPGAEHMLFVNIEDGGKSYVSRLTVRVYEASYLQVMNAPPPG